MADRTTRAERGMYWDRAYSIVEGCSPVSPGCARCWSATASAMRSRQTNAVAKRYSGLTTGNHFSGTVRFQSQDLAKPLHVRKPTTWAVWNDLFHERVTNDQILEALGVMSASPRHTYLVLTKRAERSSHFPTPDLTNVWRGITAEDQQRADERIPLLLRTPAAHRWISFEPLLGPITCLPWESALGEAVNVAVIGCESGPHRRGCREEWVRSLIDQCQAAGVSVWHKQMSINGHVEHDISKFPAWARIRQWPEVTR